MNLTTFVYLGLAGWRLASLLANEAGAFGCFESARRRAAVLTKHNRFWKSFRLYEGVTCEWCNSVWFGGALTLLYLWLGEAVLYLALPLAISTVAIIIKYIVQTLEAIKTHYELLNVTGQQPPDNRPVQMPEHYYFDPYTGKAMD